MRLDNKVAFITGGASVIGNASSLFFAKDGAIIAVVDVNYAEGEKPLLKSKPRVERLFTHMRIFQKPRIAKRWSKPLKINSEN